MANLPRIMAEWQLLAALGLAASIAHAEPMAGVQAPDDRARARLLYQANEAMRDGRFAEARDAFLSIWEATSEHEAACNVGRLSYRVGDMGRAAEFLVLCVSNASDPEQAEDARLELAQVRRRVAEVRVRAPSGTDVSIDGQYLGRAPVVAYLEPGSHTVGGMRPGSQGVERTISASAGEARVVDLDPIPIPTRPSADNRILVGAAAVSAALLGAGVVLTIAGAAEEREGDMNATGLNDCFDTGLLRCGEAAGAYDSAAKLRDWAAVGFIAGGAVAAGALTYAIHPRSHVTVTAVGSGLVVRGTW